MCYNVSVKSSKEILQSKFEAEYEAAEDMQPYYQVSGFIHPKLPVIRSDNKGLIQHCAWGLIPSWVKDETQAGEFRTMTLNAKAETIFEKPSFKYSIKKSRCLVLVDGFYEWKTAGKNKYPHFIYLKNKEPFAMGGIYSDWVNKATGEIIKTFSIITTEANQLMADIHNTKKRMPLILSREEEKKWIEPELNEVEIKNIMKPFNENEMEAHTISKLITSRDRNTNVPEVSEHFHYTELALP
ncbi:MAG: SOS response-associated peptidase [Bacteroidetes bacterium]|nr:SOS response-associated peptidase [Bacteroidota bacterium]MBA3705732.1 SOS response-associated peptidase [Bacteroidota bacterium]